MQKVDQKDRVSEFWPGAPVGGAEEGNPYCGRGTPEVHLGLL